MLLEHDGVVTLASLSLLQLIHEVRCNVMIARFGMSSILLALLLLASGAREIIALPIEKPRDKNIEIDSALDKENLNSSEAKAGHPEASVGPVLAQIEQHFFSQIHSSESSEIRLKRLEHLMFGEETTGTIEERCQKLKRCYERRLNYTVGTPAPLRGGVAMSNSPSEALQEQIAGNRKPQSSGNPDAKEIWYWIPSWAAGKWSTSLVTDHPLYGPAKLDSFKTSFSLGVARDASGRIWDCVTLPSYGSATSKKMKETSVTDYYEPVRVEEEGLCTESHSFNSLVDGTTQVVTSTYQVELQQTFAPVTNETLLLNRILRKFEKSGAELPGYAEAEVLIKTAAFQASNEPSVQDRFKAYLKKNGLESLIPKK